MGFRGIGLNQPRCIWRRRSFWRSDRPEGEFDLIGDDEVAEGAVAPVITYINNGRKVLK